MRAPWLLAARYARGGRSAELSSDTIRAGSSVRIRRAALWLMAVIVLAVLPSIVPSGYGRTLLVFVSLYAMASLGLQLLMGYAGQVSLGQGAFWGLGAYGYAILCVKEGVPPWLALAAAALASTAVAYAIGAPILRLRGHQLALATLAFATILATLFNQVTPLTGGAIGLPGIPSLAVGGFTFNTDLRFAYLAEAFVLAAMVASHNVMRSRIGRALRALSSNEQPAASLGVDVASHKLHVFAGSAALASLAGSLYAAYLTYVSPDAFGVFLSVQILLMAAVGGLATVWGAPVGAAAVVLLSQLFDTLSHGLPSGTETILESVVFGLVLAAIMITMPQGLVRGVLVRWRVRQIRTA
ncbi:MAG: branched-chain amino acid ABC transporter permease [Chloroflexota bacterium]|nr:branched-chain amino acid ABC transporter permease [Chloroflexota bacterium]